jgi:hypothetical protein
VSTDNFLFGTTTQNIIWFLRIVVRKKVIEKKGYIVKVNNFININNMTNYI